MIGRNEGNRLKLCLMSLCNFGFPIIYVDSGSFDDSIKLASQYVTSVHQLDNSSPFSAARARNEGFDVLFRQFPNLEFIQFVDGDCVVAATWFNAAQEALASNKQFALVLGHRRELNPNMTIYNRLCAMEWNSPLGELKNFGNLIGSFFIRTEVFKRMGGFKTDVIAGEDSELGVRLSLAGYNMKKIDHHMETHDANMLKFSQWWNRSVRAGHAIGQRAFLNGSTVLEDCVKERKSTLFWGVIIPLLWLLLLLFKPVLSLVVVTMYCLLTFKIYFHKRKEGNSSNNAFYYSVFVVIGKVANGIGLLKFYINRFKQHYVLIEYK